MKNKNQFVYPLSYGQQALWFAYKTAPESVAYNIFITACIRSHLNLAALQCAWDKLIEGHPILRTTYATSEGEPVQIIHEQQEIDIPVIDASSWSENYLREQIFVETDHPFDLERGPVLRLKIFTRTPKEHILVVTMHHIAGDIGSFDILLDELQTFYARETETSLTQSKPYTDFVRWESESISSSQGEQLWKYWQKQLVGELPILNLPVDKPRPPIQTYNGYSYICKLDEKTTAGLKFLAKTEGVTVYTILLSAFQVLLYHYSGQEDIPIGIPISSRIGDDFKQTVGYFVNPGVFRTKISGNLTFRELLVQNRRTVIEAKENQVFPFSLLVERLKIKRDSSRNPIFQVAVTSQKQRWYKPEEESSPGQGKKLQMEPYPLGHQRGAAFDLNLMIIEIGEDLQLCWQYNTDLFEAATIARMAKHFQTLLKGILTNVNQQIYEQLLLDETERHQLLVEWNSSQKDYPRDKCIHLLFEEQVERNPEAIAVEFEEEKLTYRQLNNRANQLARYLQKLGVKPEVLVGICVERSLEMVVGLLGILKSGGAYVPIDPAYPPDRIAYMLEDAQTPVLVTQQSLNIQLGEQKIQTVGLDSDKELIARENDENLSQTVTSSNLAYVIYTSGSTGKPKGVQIEHRSVINLFSSIAKLVEINSQDTLLSVTTISFDIAVVDFFLPITVGARLVVVSRETAKDGIQLSKALNQFQVTVMQATPVTWQLLLAAGWQGSHYLKIISTGEALPKELANQLVDKGSVLWNLYGPTEITIWASGYRVESGESSIHIGRPVDNTQFYILDSYLQPVPIGVAGELHIGGAGLARGYINQPELTAQKFISNPYNTETYLYKTGDLARYQPNGNVEYLGRIDNQVKIRGFRIELGEIETILSQHPDVKQAVVIAKEYQPGDLRLVAYIVPASQPAIAAKELRRFLQQQLPDYMVPFAFVTLESLPLTANGKIDRRALPAPEVAPQEQFVAPRDDIELQLTKIWEAVLGIKSIGVKDNFFDLGGNSLLTVRLVAEIENNFHQQLPIAALFQLSSIEELASVFRQETAVVTPSTGEKHSQEEEISNLLEKAAKLSLEDYRTLLTVVAGRQGKRLRPNSLMVALNTQGTKPPLFFCANSFKESDMLAKYLGKDQPIYLLESGWILKEFSQEKAQAIAEYHIKDILTVSPEGPYLLAGYSWGGMVMFEVAQILKEREKKIDLLVSLDKSGYGSQESYKFYKNKIEPIITIFYNHYQQISNLAWNDKLKYMAEVTKRLVVNPFHVRLEGLNAVDRIKLQKSLVAPEASEAQKLKQKCLDRVDLFLASEQPFPRKISHLIFPHAGWDRGIVNELKLHQIPGNHYTILEEPHVKVLAEKLEACINIAVAKRK